MLPPPGAKLPKGKCFQLLKSIYGLKQAGRLFYNYLSGYLKEIGFTESDADHCLLYIQKGTDVVLILVYVDDILMCSTSNELADVYTDLLHRKFSITNLGELVWCLGMRIRTSADRHSISLDLHRYIDVILERYNFGTVQPVPTPMIHTLKLSKTQCPQTQADIDEMANYPYRSAISALMFAMIVLRFDISFPVISCARFSQNPGLPHWEALVRIFKYLKGTADLQVTYSRMEDTTSPLLYGYSDADWATADLDDCRSVIAYCYIMAGGIVAWFTRFSRPCLSIFEGEFGALTEAAKEGVSIRDVASSIPLSWGSDNKNVPTTILTDSSSSVQAASEPKFHSRTKDFRIRQRWLQDIIKDGIIRVQFTKRDHNVSDFFVKALIQTSFRRIRTFCAGPWQNLKLELTAAERLNKRKATSLNDEGN
jgi:hypothetical protein